MSRETTVEYEFIATTTGMVRSDKHWQGFKNRWIKRMRQELGIWPINVPMVGFRLPSIDEQIQYAARYQDCSDRALRRGALCASSINDDDMSEVQMNFRGGVQTQIACARLTNKTDKVQYNGWMKNPETIPSIAAIRFGDKGNQNRLSAG